MKFLTTVSCDSEFAPRASYALININSDTVAVLKRFHLHAQTMAKEECAAFHYIAVFDCHADWYGPATEDDETQDLCDWLRSNLGLSSDRWHELNQGGAIRVADSFQIPESYEQRVDMPQVRVRCGSFHYASMADGSDCYQVSGDIGFGALG